MLNPLLGDPRGYIPGLYYALNSQINPSPPTRIISISFFKHHYLPLVSFSEKPHLQPARFLGLSPSVHSRSSNPIPKICPSGKQNHVDAGISSQSTVWSGCQYK